MKIALTINSVINLIIVGLACTPFFLFAAIALGYWQFGGNLLIMFVGLLDTKKVNYKLRGIYTAMASCALIALYTNNDRDPDVSTAAYVLSGVCAITYTIICLQELSSDKKRKTSTTAG